MATMRAARGALAVVVLKALRAERFLDSIIMNIYWPNNNKVHSLCQSKLK